MGAGYHEGRGYSNHPFMFSAALPLDFSGLADLFLGERGPHALSDAESVRHQRKGMVLRGK
jgi:hypothetical protein